MSERQLVYIYVVTQGNYSDYRIVGAYSRKDDARACAAALDGAHVEPYVLDPYITELHAGLKSWYVSMGPDGNCQRDPVLADSVPTSDNGPDYCIPMSKTDRRVVFAMTVWARDAEHAIKIVNEKRIQYLATHQPSDESGT